nr:RNA-directed DNA polymerase, eukaryota [Tanacetum cinerariifolium]
MIFKVDFEKAFDSVRWDYLDDILNKFGFGVKWRGWIQGCLNSAMGSILVNGSPTQEFNFHKGLKQGDPLSHFLFILVKESLHLSFNNILNAGLYKGIQLNGSVTLSHLFYADDTVFIGKWDKSNFHTIVNVLNCFFLASGLKINLHKTKLMGIGMPQDVVTMAANSIGRATLSAPFNYLGVKIGTLHRFSLWIVILREFDSLSAKGINLHSFVKKKVDNGDQTLFWEDTWLTNSPLSFFLDCMPWNVINMLVLLLSLEIPLCLNDRWVWTLESSGEFSVRSTCSYTDDALLPTVGAPTRWVSVVPIKINVFAWRVSLDRLPTRINLSLRGIDILFILCPICSCVGIKRVLEGVFYVMWWMI